MTDTRQTDYGLWRIPDKWITVPGEHCQKIAVSIPTQAGQRFTWSKTWCDWQQLEGSNYWGYGHKTQHSYPRSRLITWWLEVKFGRNVVRTNNKKLSRWGQKVRNKQKLILKLRSLIWKGFKKITPFFNRHFQDQPGRNRVQGTKFSNFLTHPAAACSGSISEIGLRWIWLLLRCLWCSFSHRRK